MLLNWEIRFLTGKAPEEQRINFICTGSKRENAEQKEEIMELLEYYIFLSHNAQATEEPSKTDEDKA